MRDATRPGCRVTSREAHAEVSQRDERGPPAPAAAPRPSARRPPTARTRAPLPTHASGDGPLGEAARAARRFAESQARDEVAFETAAAAARADAMRDAAASARADGVELLSRLLGGDAAVRAQAAAPEGAAGRPELIPVRFSIGGGAPLAAGFGSFADLLMRQSLAMLEAVEAQQQRFEAAVLQQQAAAAAALPRRGGGRLAALLAGGGAAAGEPAAAAAGGARVFAIIGGTPYQLVDLSPGAAAAAAAAAGLDLAAAEQDGGEAVGEDGWALDEVLVVVLSAVCAFTFVAFVRALVQLRSAMLSRPAEDWDAAPYDELPGGDDGAPAAPARLPPGMHSRRVSRRSGSGAGDEDLHVDERDLAGANVLVVVSHHQQQQHAGK
jgi:hypothetical protein